MFVKSILTAWLALSPSVRKLCFRQRLRATWFIAPVKMQMKPWAQEKQVCSHLWEQSCETLSLFWLWHQMEFRSADCSAAYWRTMGFSIQSFSVGTSACKLSRKQTPSSFTCLFDNMFRLITKEICHSSKKKNKIRLEHRQFKRWREKPLKKFNFF